MNRRELLKGLIAGVATVAIAAKMAPKFPEVITQSFPTGWVVTEEEIEEGLYGDIAKRYAKALAESMRVTREMATYRVLV